MSPWPPVSYYSKRFGKEINAYAHSNCSRSTLRASAACLDRCSRKSNFPSRKISPRASLVVANSERPSGPSKSPQYRWRGNAMLVPLFPEDQRMSNRHPARRIVSVGPRKRSFIPGCGLRFPLRNYQFHWCSFYVRQSSGHFTPSRQVNSESVKQSLSLFGQRRLVSMQLAIYLSYWISENTSSPCNLARPFRKVNSTANAAPSTPPPSERINWMAAAAVPPVASKSSQSNRR